MTAKEFFKSTAFKSLAVLIVIVLVAGALLAIFNDLLYVSDEEISALMDAERKFWKLVETDTPPDLTGRSGDTEALNAVYPVTDGGQETIDLYGREETVSRYLSLKQQIKALQESLDQCEQELKEDLGEHEQGQAGPYIVPG